MIEVKVSDRVVNESRLSTKQAKVYAAHVRPRLNGLLNEFAVRFGSSIFVMPATRNSATVIIGDVQFSIEGEEQTITYHVNWACVKCEEEYDTKHPNHIRNPPLTTLDEMIEVVLRSLVSDCEHLKESRGRPI